MKPILCVFFVFMSGCSANTSEQELKVKAISSFADTLVNTLKRGDSDAYQHIWVRSDDELVDINNHPLSVSIPVKEEALQKPDEIKAGFQKETEKLSEYFGQDLRKLEILKTEYIIKNDPLAQQSRLFQFELRLTLRSGVRSCLLVQRSCAMTKRGIVIGDYLTIQNEPTRQP